MKPLTNYQRAVQYLNRMFKAINERYFDNFLDMPMITIQSARNSYGYVTTSKVWVSSEDKFSYELNISPEFINRGVEDVVATLIHEAVHLYCLKKGIKDTSNKGIYHSRVFRDLAEGKGHLIVERSEKYGWSHTFPSEDTINFCIEHGFEDIQIQRGMGLSYVPTSGGSNGGQNTTTTKPSSTRKYICQGCGTSFRATRDISVLCIPCGVQFVKVT